MNNMRDLYGMFSSRNTENVLYTNDVETEKQFSSLLEKASSALSESEQDFEEAISYFKIAFGKDNKKPELWFAIGEALSTHSYIKEAEICYFYVSSTQKRKSSRYSQESLGNKAFNALMGIRAKIRAPGTLLLIPDPNLQLLADLVTSHLTKLLIKKELKRIKRLWLSTAYEGVISEYENLIKLFEGQSYKPMLGLVKYQFSWLPSLDVGSDEANSTIEQVRHLLTKILGMDNATNDDHVLRAIVKYGKLNPKTPDITAETVAAIAAPSLAPEAAFFENKSPASEIVSPEISSFEMNELTAERNSPSLSSSS